ncbi:hypothetical protein G7Y89_g7311 [Cudoniella acicularis]|uniref:Xylanolytic transcriptional activator regulatory domain-containing protein n=1 Tax=Cudoniella acicularis TaxID=354080 RepID=A0A8H4W3Y4_9HELO|nr:hypothetical protein G7Y89_g7311 [Cudoniella acicularis]
MLVDYTKSDVSRPPPHCPIPKKCQRCLKTDRKCIFTAPQKRKQRKRTDTRVAELEREVLAMRSLFERKKDGLDEETDLVARSNTLNISGETGSAVMLAATSPKNLSTISETSPNSRCSQSFPTPPPDPAASLSQPDWNAPGSNISPDLDVVEKGIVSAETADQLFQTYIKDVCQHYPIVAFPPGTSSESVRRTKPTLFLAVIAASSAITDPHLYSVLHSEAVAAYAHRTVIKSEKSLELVQALAITASWYYPPGKYSKLKFYEYIHMATTMGMDIGIGTNPKASRRRRVASSNQSSPEAAIMKKDEGELERRRTFLSVSMSMRRPNMIRYNSWVHECVAYLDANGNPDCYDNILVNWITLLQICEEIITSFSLDDPSNTVNLAESHVQLMLGGFEKKLLAWREKAESTGLSGMMQPCSGT